MSTRAKLRQDFANEESLQDAKQIDTACRTCPRISSQRQPVACCLQSHRTSQYLHDMQEEGGSEEAGLVSKVN